MTIHNSTASRLRWGVGCGVLAAAALAVTAEVGLREHSWAALSGAFLFTVFALAAYYWGMDATLNIEDGTVVYRRPIGRAKRCATSDVGWIERVVGRQGATHIEFLHDNGKRAFTVQQGFKRDELEGFAKQIGVNLVWND